MTQIDDLSSLVGVALDLGAEQVSGWSDAEKELANEATTGSIDVSAIASLIQAGFDPLGDAFCVIRDAENRRPLGQTYTPAPIVSSMVKWAAKKGSPTRVVDPGVGSGRYLVEAGREWPNAFLLGADVDPLAALMARANLAANNMSSRARVELVDYRKLELSPANGMTAFIGNPPYVRHHQLGTEWKKWLTAQAAEFKLPASQLAGLHVHFFLATAKLARPGDIGAFITSAEWLDVNYGRLVRDLLLHRLGGESVHVIDPTASPFADAATTGAVSCFRVGSAVQSMRLRSVASVGELGSLDGGREISRERLQEATRWGPLVRVSPKLEEGLVELGELCRVHRGQVTGANAVWVADPSGVKLPSEVLYPSITKAKELFAAGESLADLSALRVVIDLPSDLDELDLASRRQVERFLRIAKKQGADATYIAKARKAWWSVGLRAPAPILATYMARRPPAFVRNGAGARHINIAHGLYPRDELAPGTLDSLARYLRTSVTLGQGRTYAGGLTKFEPREMERLPVPHPEVLLHHAATEAAHLEFDRA
ncbi:Eco57I restriction-modification methylase domain-containing protein [Streptomyces albidoflavus]|uniref:Eco57I restriction-modification methylase domain-containing protein n=1 Tax=Streptomyces albidoflavus TaxID=1886 RepID=UPI0019CF6EFE|nr:N-6 DNA methylase [Streptomyces albidoflavus]